MQTSSARRPGPTPIRESCSGEGPGVFELVEEHRGDAFRAVYTVRYEKAVYVLHCFQKKSTTGVRTAGQDINLIHARLRTAQTDYEVRYGQEKD
jgi:phage-related protein